VPCRARTPSAGGVGLSEFKDRIRSTGLSLLESKDQERNAYLQDQCAQWDLRQPHAKFESTVGATTFHQAVNPANLHSFLPPIKRAANTLHPNPGRCSELSESAADHGKCLKENRALDNSEQTPNPETSKQPTGDQHDDSVLTSVARVVGSALGTVASTASKVLAPSTEDSPEPEQNQAESGTRQPQAAETTTPAPAATPSEQSQRPAANPRTESRAATGRTKSAESSSRPRVKGSAQKSSQSSGRRTVKKKKAKAKAHRRKIKRSNTNG
jgi:hypothetical protein